MRNLWESETFIEHSMFRGSYRYTWGKWQDYFYKDRLKKFLPCHYFAEMLNKDFVVYVGLPLIKKSYFLEELATEGIIKYDFQNAILICLGEDLSLEPLDDRLLRHLCDKVISSLQYEYRIQTRNIFKMDDILVEDYEAQLKKAKLRYKFKPMHFLNMDVFRFILKDFEK
jgi:hypothetical protein